MRGLTFTSPTANTMKNQLHTIHITDENGRKQEFHAELDLSNLVKSIDSGRTISQMVALLNVKSNRSLDYVGTKLDMPFGMA